MGLCTVAFWRFFRHSEVHFNAFLIWIHFIYFFFFLIFGRHQEKGKRATVLIHQWSATWGGWWTPGNIDLELPLWGKLAIDKTLITQSLILVHTDRISGSIGLFNRNWPTFNPCVQQPAWLLSNGHARKTSTERHPISACSQWLPVITQ